jgi:hypothetical protein
MSFLIFYDLKVWFVVVLSINDKHILPVNMPTLESFLFFSGIKLLLWLSILLNPLVLHWILFYCVSYCLGSFSCDYVDVSSIIPGLCRNRLYILVALVPLFLDLSQECWTVFCIMVCCATIHTCHWWKWTLPCIMS